MDWSKIRDTYSADVRLQLHIGRDRYPLGQIGPDRILLREPVALPPCDGRIEMALDGESHFWNARLSRGADAGRREIDIEQLVYLGTSPDAPGPSTSD